MKTTRDILSKISMTSDIEEPKIPFLDLKITYEELKAQLDAAYFRVMGSGHYILGEEIATFEAEFAAYCGAQYCISVANGFDALFLVLKACEIGSDDEVLVPGNTAIATWLAVSHTGAKPVAVDPTVSTYNIDPDFLAESLTKRTRAIIAVHLYGQPASMDEIRVFAQQHDLLVIEDASQAQGARYRGVSVGSLSHAAGFSFYPTKNLGAYGDAGAVVTNDEQLARRVELLRNYGSRIKNVSTVQGFNSRLDPLQAAFLRVRLQHLEGWNSRRQTLARLYLKDLEGLESCGLPVVPSWAYPVWHQFVIRHAHRDRLRDHLLKLGIETAVHYPIPPHLSEAYSGQQFDRSRLARTEQLAKMVVSLPMNPHLQPHEVARITRAILDFGN